MIAMQVELSLAGLEPQVAANAFEADIAPKLADYLRNDCILDTAGVNRVMPLLKQTYVNGIRVVNALIDIYHTSGMALIDGQPSQEIIEATRANGEAVCSNIVNNLINAQTDLLISMAWTLAAQDERIFKRPRH
jgi:hypothetical protein